MRDSVAECGPIAAGDWIAITRDGITAAVKSAGDAAVALVDVLVDDESELVTIIVGADADADDTARISEHVASAHPDVEVEVHEVTSRSTRTSSASSSRPAWPSTRCATAPASRCASSRRSASPS